MNIGFHFLGRYLGVELLGHRVDVMFEIFMKLLDFYLPN